MKKWTKDLNGHFFPKCKMPTFGYKKIFKDVNDNNHRSKTPQYQLIQSSKSPKITSVGKNMQ